MLRLKVDFWNSSMEIESRIIDNKTSRARDLAIVFDTGAYMTTIHDKTLIRAGYKISNDRDAMLSVVGRGNVPVKEVLLQGFELVDISGNVLSLGPIMVYATDMSNMETSAVLGLNVIREFVSKIKFGKNTIIELEPTFDINKPVVFEDFIRTESRFGLWTQDQIVDSEIAGYDARQTD